VYDSIDPRITTMLNPSSKHSVALTFDDGPSQFLTEILDILNKEEVSATFFWESRHLNETTPWERVIREGHLIGTHSTEHLDLTTLTYSEQYQDLSNSVKLIEQTIGKKITYFRPPYGQYNEHTLKAAHDLHLETILWRVASVDWDLKNEPQQIITNVIEHLEDGAIILLHELKQTVEVLPDLISAIKAKGYHFGNLPKKG